jgi:DNA-3-methyladenine glycosylase
MFRISYTHKGAKFMINITCGENTKKLSREFYARTSIDVAKDLLGKYLVHIVDGVEIIGKVVETEAYMGPSDKAAHSFNNRRTKRTEVMFGPPGFAYVFAIYGMHSCMNVVTAEVDSPQAVLIRALEPIAGLEKMTELRYKKDFSDCNKREIVGLTSGPGKLCKSMDITRFNNGDDLCGDSLYIIEDTTEQQFQVVTTTRININYAEEAIHYPWRFYIQGNKYVSKS